MHDDVEVAARQVSCGRVSSRSELGRGHGVLAAVGAEGVYSGSAWGLVDSDPALEASAGYICGHLAGETEVELVGVVIAYISAGLAELHLALHALGEVLGCLVYRVALADITLDEHGAWRGRAGGRE